MRRKSATSAWRHSMSLTKKTPEHCDRACDLPWPVRAAAAAAGRAPIITRRRFSGAMLIRRIIRSSQRTNPRTRLSASTFQKIRWLTVDLQWRFRLLAKEGHASCYCDFGYSAGSSCAAAGAKTDPTRLSGQSNKHLRAPRLFTDLPVHGDSRDRRNSHSTPNCNRNMPRAASIQATHHRSGHVFDAFERIRTFTAKEPK